MHRLQSPSAIRLKGMIAVKYDLTRCTDEDRLVMNEPARWPYFPFLPIKRHKLEGGWPEVATLCPHPISLTPTVLHVPFWQLGELSREQLNNVARTNFDTLEEVIAQGWVVD